MRRVFSGLAMLQHYAEGYFPCKCGGRSLARRASIELNRIPRVRGGELLEGVNRVYPITESHVREVRQACTTPEERVVVIAKASEEGLTGAQARRIDSGFTAREKR